MQKTKFNRICIIGLGYIGLPTAVAFANAGKQVIGVDINEQVVASLKQGKIHIIEPDLQTAFTQAVKNGYFLQLKRLRRRMPLLLQCQRHY